MPVGSLNYDVFAQILSKMARLVSSDSFEIGKASARYAEFV
jgi:hypothetical protein